MRVNQLRICHEEQMMRRCIVRPFFPLVPVACFDVRFEGGPFTTVDYVEPYDGQDGGGQG